MRWEDERYVRIYVRDTADDLLLSWQARALWHEMLRKFDRVGVIELGRGDVRGLAGLVRIPVDVVELALPELLEDGRVVRQGTAIVAPNYVEAQEAVMSNRLRQEAFRDRQRARDAALSSNDSLRKVTPSNAEQREVTGVTPSVPSLPSVPSVVGAPSAQPSQPESSKSEPPKTSAAERSKPKRLLPDDWQPKPAHREKTSKAGLNLEREADRFRNHHAAKGSRFVDWDRAFHTWLDNAEDWSSRGQPKAQLQPASDRCWTPAKEL